VPEQKRCPDFAFLPKVGLSEMLRTERGAFLDVWLPLADRIWAREKTNVALDDLLGALKTTDIREASRQKLQNITLSLFA